MGTGRSSAVLGVIAIAVLIWGGICSDARAHVPEVSGVVQEWSPDVRILVVEGIRYTLGTEFEVVDEDGRTLSPFQVKVGSRVRIVELDGAVRTIVLLPTGAEQ